MRDLSVTFHPRETSKGNDSRGNTRVVTYFFSTRSYIHVVYKSKKLSHGVGEMAQGGVKATCSLPEDPNSVPNTHFGTQGIPCPLLASAGTCTHLAFVCIPRHSLTHQARWCAHAPAVRRLTGSGVTATLSPTSALSLAVPQFLPLGNWRVDLAARLRRA